MPLSESDPHRIRGWLYGFQDAAARAHAEATTRQATTIDTWLVGGGRRAQRERDQRPRGGPQPKPAPAPLKCESLVSAVARVRTWACAG